MKVYYRLPKTLPYVFVLTNPMCIYMYVIHFYVFLSTLTPKLSLSFMPYL
jgi:hypothetical protein